MTDGQHNRPGEPAGSGLTAEIHQIRIGQVCAYGPDNQSSAYRKVAVSGPLRVSTVGLAGDEQADLEHHGGIDKAVLHYDFGHYATWRREKPELAARLQSAGAFGENISASGLTEATVCLGDRFRLGTALVEISQGRQPCWKLGHWFGEPRMVAEVLKLARGGWYYRVIEPGQVSAGDRVVLVERPCPDWTVARLFRTLFSGAGQQEELRYLADEGLLSQSWRSRAGRLIRG